MTEKSSGAVVIAIGDELLLGEIDNTNTTFICRQLGENGVPVSKCLVLPDNRKVISSNVSAVASMVDLVVVCGGIGPTPDDVTRPAIADACGVSLELNDAAVSGYESRRGKPLNTGQREMCRLPSGCELIWSDYPSPPAFRINNIYVFPGVPDILKSAWGEVADRFKNSRQFTMSFTTKKGESRWFSIMQDVINRYPDLKIGSYPKMDQDWSVEIRIRGANEELVRSAIAEFEQEIDTC